MGASGGVQNERFRPKSVEKVRFGAPQGGSIPGPPQGEAYWTSPRGAIPGPPAWPRVGAVGPRRSRLALIAH